MAHRVNLHVSHRERPCDLGGCPEDDCPEYAGPGCDDPGSGCPKDDTYARVDPARRLGRLGVLGVLGVLGELRRGRLCSSSDDDPDPDDPDGPEEPGYIVPLPAMGYVALRTVSTTLRSERPEDSGERWLLNASTTGFGV